MLIFVGCSKNLLPQITLCHRDSSVFTRCRTTALGEAGENTNLVPATKRVNELGVCRNDKKRRGSYIKVLTI